MNEATPSVTFFHSTYEEALALTHEARDYLGSSEWRERNHGTATESLVASCESLRLTARLTQVMAWLLVQRAVHAGELSRDQAKSRRYRLAGRRVCSDNHAAADGQLEPRLRDLLDRSHRLYLRVQRLDAMQDAGGAGPPPISDPTGREDD